MLFGSLLQVHNDNDGQQLMQIQQTLKDKIQRAKDLISSIQTTSAGCQEHQFSISSSGQLVFPSFNSQLNYNQQFWKTYLQNQLNFRLIKQITDKTSELQQHVKQIDKMNEQYMKLYKLKNRKKNRRLAVQIDKKYQCPYEKCYKYYGSDVSLNLHIKLKHKGGNKTDRQKLAQQICLAQIGQGPEPEITYNLPPGFLDDYRTNIFKKNKVQSS